MCLRYQVIDDNGSGVSRVGQARGLINNVRGVGGGRGIDNAYKRSDTTTETAGGRRQTQGIYDNDGGVGGVI